MAANTLARGKAKLAVALIHPLIHWNTGAIGRSCLGFESSLHLIRPLGFSLDERAVRRAGLDYWKNVDLHVHDDWNQFVANCLPNYPQRVIFSKSEKLGTKCLFDHSFSVEENTVLIMGSEKYGVPPEIADTLSDMPGMHCVYLPMSDMIRSYNVANAASMALLEYARQCYTTTSSTNELYKPKDKAT